LAVGVLGNRRNQRHGKRSIEVKGVFREVNPAENSLTIEHENIPGFISAMTMSFAVKDPRLLQGLIDDHPSVREATVFGIPYPQWGQLVMACVVLKPGMTLTEEELIRHCRERLSSHKTPRRVEFSDTELPKSGSEKIMKRVLRERFWAGKARAVG
jgi:hypothetical protein